MNPHAVARTDLLAMLGVHGQRFLHAHQALSTGGTFVVWDGLVPATQLASTYARRHKLTTRRGTPTIALDETVTIPRDLGQTPVRIGRIDADDGEWAHMMFLTPEADAVIACTSVKRPAPAGTP